MPFVQSVGLSVIFTETFTSRSFIPISPPNLKGIFMALKTCLKIWSHFEKQNGHHS